MIYIPAGEFAMGSSAEEIAQLAQACAYHVSWFSGG